jgi:hypothetical protein
MSSNMTTTGGDYVTTPAVGETIMNLFMGSFSVVLVTLFMIVYLVDYYALQRSAKPVVVNNSKLELGTIWKAGSVCEKIRDKLLALTDFTTKDLHKLIIANFVSLIVYMLFFTLSLLPDVDNVTMAWISSLYIALYGVTKAISAAYFIVRYQVTAKELRVTPKYLIPVLWVANLFAFLNMFISLFSDPPYVQLISVSGGLATTLMFIISYCSIEIVLLFLLISPLSKHLNEIKTNLNSSMAQLPPAERSVIAGSNTVKEERKRIKLLARVVQIAILACAVSVILTAFENIIYCIAFYIFPDETPVNGYFVWRDVYNWSCFIEMIICSLTPVFNYSRFKVMWKLQGCRRNEQVEDILIESTGNQSNRNKSKEILHPPSKELPVGLNSI